MCRKLLDLFRRHLRREKLIQKPGPLVWIRLAERVGNHVRKSRSLIGSKHLRDAFGDHISWSRLDDLLKVFVSILRAGLICVAGVTLC
jgi:hypothetical protein